MEPTPIYLQIHYTLTKRAIAEHIQKFNQDIEKQWLENADAFREKYCLTPKQTYKCITVKAAVHDTILAILDMYAKFLQSNENRKIADPVFKITNKGVKTKRIGLLSKKTIIDHRKRATRAGIFLEDQYVFHGTNSGFEINFNPAVLAACMHPAYTEIIVNNYVDSVEKSVINPEKLTLLSTVRPPFLDSKNGYIVTNRNYIIVPVQLQEHNINMDDAEIVKNNLLTQLDFNNYPKNDAALAAAGTEQEHRSISPEKMIGSLALNFKHLRTEKQEQKLRPREIERVRQNEDISLLQFHISSSLKLILNVLYKDKFIPDQHLRQASKDLQQYFQRKQSGKTLLNLSDDLWLAVMEAHKSRRRTGFTPAPLPKYLDVYFKGGLLSTTLEHVEKNVKPYIQRNKDIIQSISDANQWYQLFVKSNNNTEVYRKATQNLNKKKNKNYLDFFNDAVIEHKNFNKQIIYEAITSQ